jgi:hypothetical protein
MSSFIRNRNRVIECLPGFEQAGATAQAQGK